ncbi:PAS domain S-box protein, partial [Chloroflexota bacterium]
MKKTDKRTKSRMSESAELAQAVMRCPGLGIYIVQDGKFQYANALFQELTGYAEQELRSIHPLDLVHPEDRELVREKAIENLKGHNVLPYEYRFIKKNGDMMWNLERLASIQYRGKQAAVGSFMDITDSKRMKEALAEEATRRRVLMERSRDGISVLDENSKVIEANQRFAEMLGYTPEELKDLHTWDWDTQWTREELLEMGRNVDEAGAHLETRHRRKDGTFLDVELSVNSAVVAGKKLIFCVSRDITERKRAEEALAEEATRRRILMERSRDGINVLDENSKLVEANQRFAEMLGYTPEELKGLHTWDWDTQWTREELLEMGRNIDEAGAHLETRHRRKDGTFLDVDLSVNSAVVAGKKLLFCVSRDITERKQDEEALRLSEQNFHDSIENSPLGIRVLDKDEKTLYANRALLDIWGYSSIEEMEAVPREKRYTPESYAEHLERLEKGKRGEHGSLSFETSIVRSDGQVRILSASRGELLWNGKKQSQIVYQDITESKQAEEAIRRSEESFHDSIENSPLGIRVIDKEGKTLYANRALLDFWGYSSIEEMEAVPRKQRYTPQTYAEHLERLAKRKRGKPVPLSYETGIVRSDGQVRILSVSRGELLWNGEKQFQIVSQDITERKQAEQNFHDSIEKSPLGIRVIDKKGKHLYANRALLDMWGYGSVEEMEAVPREQRYTPESYAEHMERLAKRKRGEPAPLSYELSIVRSDGQVRHLWMSRGELMWSGEQQFQIVYQDITARKQAEQNFRDSIENSPLGIHVIDKDGKHLYSNRALLDMWGYGSVEEMEA